ncbi:DUF1045 domain-containing protein [Undibacterium jejuense]|uniref:DUF1045 domain-containing protein n=1 Tax=Undibacterium jejuense TaxID=1344949 RepID=A0A923HNE4_9BURK|nr:DUF1045 domain-containing protein [Undibacterium jejuense]MBC3862776.1 DUF1045 domain-containing protein [Undibacterium jejuense]
MSRYALYFAPEQDSKWWHAGCQWLGRDPETSDSIEQIRIPSVLPNVLQNLTKDARRYGFHATLKAPFRLAPGHQVEDLEMALRAFCRRQQATEVPSPQLEWMGDFLAIRPVGDTSLLNQLAMQCVSQFDHLRAALKPEELARRQQQQLSARQLRLLQHWGYPYTAEEYRFHMTITDSLNNTDSVDAMLKAAGRHFDIGEPLVIRSIALFHEAHPGENLRLLRRYPFGD